jgi:hypothetical protein
MCLIFVVMLMDHLNGGCLFVIMPFSHSISLRFIWDFCSTGCRFGGSLAIAEETRNV